MTNIMISLVFIFLLSRFYTANPAPVWFDSLEYLTRFASPNFLQALTSGHYPLHAGYILLFKNLPLITSQIILGLAGMIAFYKLTNSKMAVIIASLLPIVWLSQTTVMMEAAYVPLFLISLYLFKKQSNFFGAIFFSLSLLTHLVVLLWIPLILYFNPKTWRWLVGAIIITSAINAYLISPDLIVGLKEVYLSKAGEHVQLTAVLPLIRNWLIPLLRNNTNLIVILAFFSLLRRPAAIFWLGPTLITNQWWDSLLYGRHSLIASFGLALLVAQILKGHRLWSSITITYLLLTVIPTVALLKTPIPYQETAKLIKDLPPGGLLIDSHFARPQTTGVYSGETIYVNEPGWTFKDNRQTFVTAAALSDPYGLYSGPYLHSLSLSYKDSPTLKQYLGNKSFKKINDQIYQVTDFGMPYPETNLYFSPRRLDFYDPLSRLWFMAIGRDAYPEIRSGSAGPAEKGYF